MKPCLAYYCFHFSCSSCALLPHWNYPFLPKNVGVVASGIVRSSQQETTRGAQSARFTCVERRSCARSVPEATAFTFFREIAGRDLRGAQELLEDGLMCE